MTSHVSTPNAQRTAGRPWYERAAWLGILIGGVLTYVVLLMIMVDTSNPNFFPSLLLVGSVTVPLASLTFAWGSGPSSPIPAPWMVFTAVVGGLLGIMAAGILEYRELRLLPVGQMAMVGLIEESVKLLVPIVVMAMTGRRWPRAGVVIGVASGMGFATLETMGYGFVSLLQAGSIAAVDNTLLLRALLAPAGHVAWTGLNVAALWRLRNHARGSHALLRFVSTFLLTVVLHALWDGTGNLFIHIGVVVISVGLLLLEIARANRPVAPGRD